MAMHKGWWVAVLAVVFLLALGGAAHYSAHSGDVVEPPPVDVEPEIDIEELLTGYEVMLVPAASLGATDDTVLESATCARLCAVPGERDGALTGWCSTPLSVAGVLDGDDGKQLVIAVPPAAGSGAYSYLAARERRVLIVAAERCDAPPTDPEPAEKAEPEEAS